MGNVIILPISGNPGNKIPVSISASENTGRNQRTLTVRAETNDGLAHKDLNVILEGKPGFMTGNNPLVSNEQQLITISGKTNADTFSGFMLNESWASFAGGTFNGIGVTSEELVSGFNVTGTLGLTEEYNWSINIDIELNTSSSLRECTVNIESDDLEHYGMLFYITQSGNSAYLTVTDVQGAEINSIMLDNEGNSENIRVLSNETWTISLIN